MRREDERAKSVMDGLMRSSKRQVRRAEGKSAKCDLCSEFVDNGSVPDGRDGREKGQALEEEKEERREKREAGDKHGQKQPQLGTERPSGGQ